MSQVKALLFDMDGTLVDTERETGEAMANAFQQELGIQISQEEKDYIIGRSWVDIYKVLKTNHPQLLWARDEVIRQTAIYREEVFEKEGLTVLPGAKDAVMGLGDFPRAIVTGSSREEAKQVLNAMGWSDVFTVVMASEDVPTSKPEPDGYLMAAKALGVSIKNCVVIEESKSGIGAGRRSGAYVLAVRAGNYRNQDQSEAHQIIDTLEELSEEFLTSLKW